MPGNEPDAGNGTNWRVTEQSEGNGINRRKHAERPETVQDIQTRFASVVDQTAARNFDVIPTPNREPADCLRLLQK